jgi:hypothetical protein
LDLKIWTGSIWLGIGTFAGTYKCGNEPMGSIKRGEFLDYLKTCYLLRKDSAAWSKYALHMYIKAVITSGLCLSHVGWACSFTHFKLYIRYVVKFRPWPLSLWERSLRI